MRNYRVEKSVGCFQVAEMIDEKFVKRLEKDFPGVKFVWGAKRFSYRLMAGVPTVFLGEPQPNFGLLALHELGHALSKHKDYTRDVERIKIESEAWERAKTVLFEYRKKAKVLNSDDESIKEEKRQLLEILPEWDEDFVQEKMDTYRDWLHTKSRCRKCGLTRYQTEDGKYHCPRCEAFI